MKGHAGLLVTAALAASAAPTLAVTAEEPRGSIVVVGTGEASAVPEVGRLNLEVISICYDTSRDSKNANAELANRLVAVLREFATDPRDEVTALGGPNVRQSETVPVGQNQFKTICERKWRATNLLSIKLSKIESLPDLQDRILAEIDQASDADPDKVAQSYAGLGQPVFGLHEETALKLRRQAQAKAYDDAKAQVEAFQARCLFQDLSLTAIAPPADDDPRHYRMKMGDGVATPLIPEKIIFRASWKFTWSYASRVTCTGQ